MRTPNRFDTPVVAAKSDSAARATELLYTLVPDLERFNVTVEAVHGLPIPAAQLPLAVSSPGMDPNWQTWQDVLHGARLPFALFCGVAGRLIGSFLNVVI